MKKIDVFDGRTLSGIQYSADGTIFSNDPDLDEDLKLWLNLNCAARGLKDCRLRALQTLHIYINNKYPNKTAPKQFFQELLAHYESQSEHRTPYSGILIAWLRTKI